MASSVDAALSGAPSQPRTPLIVARSSLTSLSGACSRLCSALCSASYSAGRERSRLGALPHRPCGEIVQVPGPTAEECLDRSLEAIQPSRIRAEARPRASLMGRKDGGELAVEIALGVR